MTRKFLALILALCLLIPAAVPALAQEGEPVTITIAIGAACAGRHRGGGQPGPLLLCQVHHRQV